MYCTVVQQVLTKHDLAVIYHGGRVAADEEMPSDDEDEEDDGLTQVQRKVSKGVQTHPGPEGSECRSTNSPRSRGR
jgi:hypothetical protein